MTKKPGQRDPGPVDLPIRPPTLPPEVIDRFPALAKWEDEWARIWETLRANVRARDSEVETRLTKLEKP